MSDPDTGRRHAYSGATGSVDLRGF
ncbi:uncharacterized protein DNG_07226 [Cephalotrichum gorgonifer]|uniref:Uncharacterized protein n=1 Tax=Cephalotrichum gorgonifer TaxID=2041049 RepID=A0AAE8N1A2_9PEZI|nr:uncharacterized protein DNG_07226 [Cephalotrichum gorgonifer]